MITLQQRINAFAGLGLIMNDAASPAPSSVEARKLRKLMDQQEQHNRWFTRDNVRLSVKAIAGMLERDRLEKWLQNYNIQDKNLPEKTIAVIMAGNIPLVGFHDFMCVLISGNKLLARTSSKDSELIKKLAEILIRINNEFGDYISFTIKISLSYDAVIATGSNNTSRYFEYYFGRKPHIFRRNRNSVAVIDRYTSDDDIEALGLDIFSYFGLGCRNVSKIYIHESIRPEDIFSKWQGWSKLLDHRSYINNYLHNKSLFKINGQAFLDNGFMLFMKNTELSSPVAVSYYDFFNDTKVLINELGSLSDQIQCIVSEHDTPFGLTQYPGPEEYADNMDTLEFISSL